MRATEAVLAVMFGRRVIGAYWRTNSGGLAPRRDGGLRPLRSTPGVGDWTVVMPVRVNGVLVGLHVEIECKRPVGGVWSEPQRAHARRIVEAGGGYAIVRSGDEAMRAVEALAAGQRFWSGSDKEEIDR